MKIYLHYPHLSESHDLNFTQLPNYVLMGSMHSQRNKATNVKYFKIRVA